MANIGKRIAEAEGFDVTEMVIACLLHDVAYGLDFPSEADWNEHGRWGAQLVRPFLKELGMPEERAQDILYGIAIHVDDKADFEGERTAFARTVSDADNIDRFDAYRIYEGLEFRAFSKLPLDEKRALVARMLERLPQLREMETATETAKLLWQEKIDFMTVFYEKLLRQLDTSEHIFQLAD